MVWPVVRGGVGNGGKMGLEAPVLELTPSSASRDTWRGAFVLQDLLIKIRGGVDKG